MKRNEITEAKAGDIIAISGINDIFVGETIASAEDPEALPFLKIDPPTLQMDFVASDSPFAGREGDKVTPKKLEDRLIKQTRTDVSLKNYVVKDLNYNFHVQKLFIVRLTVKCVNHMKLFKLIHQMNTLVQ